MMDNVTPKTLSVPKAGKIYFNLSRNGSYAAAARGEIPTVRIGRLLRVPVIVIERMLEEAGERIQLCAPAHPARPADETRQTAGLPLPRS